MTRSRFILAAGFGATSVLNYAFALAMGWLLVPADFGTLAFAQSVILVCGLLLQAGVPWSLARAMNAEAGAWPSRIRGALVANLGLAAATGAAIALLYAAGPLRPGLENTTILALVVLTLPLISVSATARGALQGAGRFAGFTALQIVEVAGKAAGGAALVTAGLGSAGAVAGFAVGALVAAAAAAVVLARLGVGVRGALLPPPIGCALPMLGTLVGLTLLMNWDLLLVKSAYPDGDLAGQYQASLVLANAPYFLVSASLIPVLFMRVSRLSSLRASIPPLVEALRLALLVTVPLELVLVAAPEAVLGALFPAEYLPGAPLLRILALGNILLVVVAVLATGLRAIGRARLAATVVLAVAAVEPAVLAVVVPRAGGEGAAIVFAAASALAMAAIAMAYAVAARAERAPGTPRADRSAELRWMLRFGAALLICIACAAGSFAATHSEWLSVSVALLSYLMTLVPLRLVGRPRFPVAG